MSSNTSDTALVVDPIVEKRQKERTLAKMLIKQFSHYGLEEGEYVKGMTTFQFERLRGEPHKRASIIFHGAQASHLKDDVQAYLTSLGHTWYKHVSSPSRGLAVMLSKIEPSPLGDRNGVAPNSLVNDSPNENLKSRVSGDPDLVMAMNNIRDFHETRLILGVRNKDNEFEETEDGLAIKWNYASETEVVYVLDEAKKLFGYEPKVLKATRGEEVIISWGLNKIPQDIDRRKFRKFQTREFIQGHTITPVEVVDFLCKKILRLGSGYKNNRCHDKYPIGCFHVKDEVARNVVFSWLERFNIAFLSSEIDGQCFWIALNGEVKQAFEVCKGNELLKPTELIKKIQGGEVIKPEEKQMEKKKNRSKQPEVVQNAVDLVRSILKQAMNARVSREYTYTPMIVAKGSHKGELVISVGFMKGTVCDEATLSKIQGLLPENVSARFEGVFGKPSKGLNFYFGKVRARRRSKEVPQRKSKKKVSLTTLMAPVQGRKDRCAQIYGVLRRMNLTCPRDLAGKPYPVKPASASDLTRLVLGQLSKKAVRVFKTEKSNLLLQIPGVTGIDLREARGGHFGPTLVVNFVASDEVVTDTTNKVIDKRGSSSKDKLHLQVFAQFSAEQQKECLKMAKLDVNGGGQDELLKKLKGFIIVDAKKGKSLETAIKALDALVDPKTLLKV